MTPNSIDYAEILTWYADAGIDVAMDDTPVDRFAQSAAAAAASAKMQGRKSPAGQPTPAANRPTAARTAPPAAERRPAPPRQQERAIPDAGVVQRATELAQEATTLAELKDVIEKFDLCNLKFTARSTVFADGNAHVITVPDILAADAEADSNSDAVVAPMTGAVRGVTASVGAKVSKGDTLILMEPREIAGRLGATTPARTSAEPPGPSGD